MSWEYDVSYFEAELIIYLAQFKAEFREYQYLCLLYDKVYWWSYPHSSMFNATIAF